MTADGWQCCCVCRTKQSFFMWLEQNGYSSSWPHLFLISFFFIYTQRWNDGLKVSHINQTFHMETADFDLFFSSPIEANSSPGPRLRGSRPQIQIQKWKKSQLSTTISRCRITNWTRANILLLCVCGFESILIVFAVLGKPKYSHMYVILLELVFSLLISGQSAMKIWKLVLKSFFF